MRVIKGKAKGRRLKASKGLDIRPTSDKVKESVFNIIGDKIDGAVFLDLCAGIGNVGIEAASRGAKEIAFVESNQKAVKLIKENLLLCHLEEYSNVIFSDAVKFLKTAEGKFDIIFFDPPYRSGLLQDALAVFEKKEMLNPDGILIVEHLSRTILSEKIGGLILLKKYKYGDTTLSLYKRKEGLHEKKDCCVSGDI